LRIIRTRIKNNNSSKQSQYLPIGCRRAQATKQSRSTTGGRLKGERHEITNSKHQIPSVKLRRELSRTLKAGPNNVEIQKSKYKTQKCLYFRLFFAFCILIFYLPLLCHFELLFLHFAWICPDFFEDAR